MLNVRISGSDNEWNFFFNVVSGYALQVGCERDKDNSWSSSLVQSVPGRKREREREACEWLVRIWMSMLKETAMIEEVSRWCIVKSQLLSLETIGSRSLRRRQKEDEVANQEMKWSRWASVWVTGVRKPPKNSTVTQVEKPETHRTISLVGYC